MSSGIFSMGALLFACIGAFYLLLAIAGVILGLIGLHKWKQCKRMQDAPEAARREKRNGAIICGVLGAVIAGYGLLQALTAPLAILMLYLMTQQL